MVVEVVVVGVDSGGSVVAATNIVSGSVLRLSVD